MSRRGFTKLSNATLDTWSMGLSSVEFKVVVYLFSLGWGDRPAKSSIGTTAARCGISKTAAYRAASSLTQRGILVPLTIGSGRAASSYRVDPGPDLAFRQGNGNKSHKRNAIVPPAERYRSPSGTLQSPLRFNKDSKKEGTPAVANGADSFCPNDPLATVFACCRCGAPITAKEAADESLTDATEHGYQHVLCLTSPS
jgi:hypothetical protein